MIAASSGEASYGASFAVMRVSVGQHVWFTTAGNGWTCVLSQNAAEIMSSGKAVSARTMCFTLGWIAIEKRAEEKLFSWHNQLSW
jgi:hypothetical protein